MKALFKNHFPFVESPESELDPSQKLIKQTYEKLYPKEEIKTVKTNRLREVHGNDEPAEGAGKE